MFNPGPIIQRAKAMSAAVGGPRAAAPVLARWLMRREYIVHRWTLAGELADVRVPPGARWTLASEADVATLCRLNERLAPATVREYLASGHECLLGWIGSDLAYYRWDADAPARLPYLGVTLTCRVPLRVAVEVFTAPNYRQRGLGSYMFQVALARALTIGHRHFVGLMATWNTPIRRMVQRTGGREIGRIGYRNLVVKKRYFSTGHVRLVPAKHHLGAEIDVPSGAPER